MPIRETTGFLVVDSRGHSVGHVECPLYGTAPDKPDALAVRSRGFLARHFIIPAAAIETIDDLEQLIGLRLKRERLQRFL